MNTTYHNDTCPNSPEAHPVIMKSALVIGCTGAFGSAIAKELLSCGWTVKALMRNPDKCPTWLPSSQVIEGDCRSLTDVEKAAKDIDLIVYGANPIYTDWHKKAEAMLEPTALVAEKRSLHVLFPGNVYAFDPSKTPTISETSEQCPVTDKGVIRQRMEQRLKQASQRGATVTLVRIGDFIAKNSESAMINHLLVRIRKSWTLANPSPATHQHNFAWLPDVAANAVALLSHDKSGFNVWHEPGIVTTHQQWLSAFEKLKLPVKSIKFPW
ncbi:NAD(P)H-binding protein [Photobacterium sp. OFAV2-7]|uniref:NAD(P)H-binding protein n=1 Tax=Photobacterium sp. OFAV2-7 TaxID=2917748 RepID=UPI001EF65DDB|nr:NAD(P)H-binding protein [Photobacterium sp. OFAV2-7]MCG7585951.1 NAD(P)H-binding protein [Photobacterium sp. OFAV2-7]